MLAAVLLGSSPTGEVFPVLLVLLAVTGGLAWLVARYVASARSVGLAVASTLAVLLIAGATWAWSAPDHALFLARQIAWGDSNVKDYQKFPERVVGDAPPVFHFTQSPSPELFETIEYQSEGQLKQAGFEEFLQSTQTTSFIVIKDDVILYEGYFNGYSPLLLGMILERTTGRPVAEYLQEKIWKPLDMEYPASWSLDSEASGFELMVAGINARAIDFARFGRLFLNHGNWNGQQIISEQWVTESTAPDPNDHRPWHSYSDWKEANGYYKYLWWGKLKPDGSYDFMAQGKRGQRIVVSPQERMVVVRFGIDDEGVDAWEDVIESVIARVK